MYFLCLIIGDSWESSSYYKNWRIIDYISHVELIQEPENNELKMEGDMARVAPPEEINIDWLIDRWGL